MRYSLLVDVVIAGLCCCSLLLGCNKARVDTAVWSAEEARLLRSLCLDMDLLPSPGNAYADDEKAAKLGKKLFFDKRLSANGQVACATCHDPKLYFTDGKPVSEGIGHTPRNAPTIIGAQWLPFVFWDGRKDSLWSQALGPVEADVEHGFSRVAIAKALGKHYRKEASAVLGELPDFSDDARFPAQARPVVDETSHPHHLAWKQMTAADQRAVNDVFAKFGKLLEAYERKLLPTKAPFDALACHVKANDAVTGHKSMSDLAQKGARQFIGQAGCVNCHNGPLLTDKTFHNLGLPGTKGVSGVDVGRTLGAKRVKEDPFSCGGQFSDDKQCDELKFLNPRFDDFLGAFKTPSLRNVTKTAPYMHAGQLATLKDVLKHYKELPGKARIGHRDLILKQIDPDVDAEALIAFLETLTGPLPDKEWLGVPR